MGKNVLSAVKNSKAVSKAIKNSTVDDLTKASVTLLKQNADEASIIATKQASDYATEASVDKVGKLVENGIKQNNIEAKYKNIIEAASQDYENNMNFGTVSATPNLKANIKWDNASLSANELEMQATEAALENSGKITSTEVQKEQMRRWSVTPGDGMKIETNKPFVPSKTYNVGTPESANGLLNTGNEFDVPTLATDSFTSSDIKDGKYNGIVTHPKEYSKNYTYENIDRNHYIKPALSKEQMDLTYGTGPYKETPWASTARAALGTAVAGGALMAALSSSRGQQNNAQLYGQQPLY